MKKQAFYTFMKRDGAPVAIRKEGYTDGPYYYYKSDYCGLWFAIHPLTGLAFANGYTRKEAATNAHDPAVKLKLVDFMEKRGPELIAAFDKALNDIGV